MASRLTVVVLGGFWGLMTLLLWRAEYGPGRFQGTTVAPTLVWQKVLTSPDSSSLAIIHRGQRIGFCHIIASVTSPAESSGAKRSPEGMVREVGGYQLDLTGSLHPPDSDLRLRFSGRVLLTAEHEWESFQAELVSRPTIVEVSADHQEGTLKLSVNSPDLQLQRSLRLADLRSPEAVMRELLGPAAALLPAAQPFALEAASLPGLGVGLEWTATTDLFQVRESYVPAYRLSARLFENSSAVLYISRAGEILRVELPDDMLWINDALAGN
jgi:hypothetical protein